MTLSLSKRIPARTKTVHFNWISRNFLPMSSQYRAIREKCKYQGFSCFWCNHKFEDGEQMALGQVKGSGNKVLCSKCADEAEGSQR